MTPTRRSTRNRRQARSFIDEKNSELESMASSSTKTSKKRKAVSEDDDSEKESKASKRKGKKDPVDEETEDQEEEKEQQEREEEEEEEDKEEEEREPSSESEDDSSEASVEPRSKRRKGKPLAARRTKISGPARKKPPPKRSRRRGTSKKLVGSTIAAIKRKVLEKEDTAENSILAAVLHEDREEKTQDAARRVAQVYAKDPNQAHTTLVDFILRCIGGATEVIDVDWEYCQEEELSELLDNVVKSMEMTAEDVVLLYLSAKSSSRANLVAQEFRKSYEYFWEQLVEVILVEGIGLESEGNDDDASPAELVQTILERLVALAHVGVTDVRIAATLAIFSMGVALVSRMTDLEDKLAKSERQMQAASKQVRKKAALKSQMEAHRAEKEKIGDLVQGSVISAVFMKRYKDICSQVRAISVQTLSRYTLINPEMFLKNAFLKYVGWLLSDKDAQVRQSAIECFRAPLVSDLDGHNVQQAMEGAINKFLPRLCDCVIDVDVSVQESAMKLFLALMDKNFLDDMVDDNMWNQINLRAVASNTSPEVRLSALLFVIEQLEPFEENSRKTEKASVEQIRALVQWIVHVIAEGDIPPERIRYDLTDFVVSSLRSSPKHKDLICNWGAIMRAFELDTSGCKNPVDDDGDDSVASTERNERRIDFVKQRVLLRMLICAVETEVSSLSGNSVDSIIDPALQEAQKARRSEIPQLEKKSHAEKSTHEELTLELLRTLPNLLTMFKSESSVLAGLVGLPQYFDTGVFNLSSRKKDFLRLLNALASIFLEATDSSVLNQCALALTSLASTHHARSGDVHLKLKKITRSLQDRLLELLMLKSGTKTDEDTDSEDMKLNAEETEFSICLCLRRLKTLSRRQYVAELLVDDKENFEEVDKVCDDLFTSVSAYVAQELNSRKSDIEDSNGDELDVPEIWDKADGAVHERVADSICEAVTLLLTVLAWRLQKEIKAIGDDEDQRETLEHHIVLRMRDRLLKLVSLCFEQYIDAETFEYAEVHIAFSEKIQAMACRIAGDIRTLFPKAWKQSVSNFLALCAVTEDDSFIGGSVRFLQSQESKLKDPETASELADDTLLPMTKSLAANWNLCNRREAGMVLAHLADEIPEIDSLISSLSSIAKSIDPFRLLEAHMACLTQSFDAWLSAEPEEPESDHPSEEELTVYDEACFEHKRQLSQLEALAAKLSASLGKGKLSNSTVLALRGFFRVGLEYSFSDEDPFDDGEPVVGMRLAFLRLIGKYLSWIKRDTDGRKKLAEDMDIREIDLRRHPDFDQVLMEDKEALNMFRKEGGLKILPKRVTGTDGDESHDGDSATESFQEEDGPTQKSFVSQGSILSKSSTNQSSSLSPLVEEGEDDAENDIEQLEDIKRDLASIKEDSTVDDNEMEVED